MRLFSSISCRPAATSRLSRLSHLRTSSCLCFLTAVLLSLLLATPSDAALYNYSYPTAPDKKGLAIRAGMEEDALELGVHHTTINFPISQVLASRSEKKRSVSSSYRYQGKTYWFRKSQIRAWDSQLNKLKANNTIVTGILLMQYRPDLKSLIYPNAQGKSASCYAWNMDGGANQKTIEATISYLASRYSSGKHGRVVGWIVGNEIDSASTWNCAGNISFDDYMDLYARMFEAVSRVVLSIYGNARVYIPLDHYWNMRFGNDYTAKQCLDSFALRMRQDGYPWNLAYHAYNADLMQPSITAPQYFGVTNEPTSPVITMRNLTVLTDYIQSQFGAGHRVILSEHGYSSTWKGTENQGEQSRAIALSYYLAQNNSLVDSFVYYSQVDQGELTRVGANFGLWKESARGLATSKKASWTTFKYMDTDALDAAAQEAAGAFQKLTGNRVTGTRTMQRTRIRVTKKYRLKKKLKTGWRACGILRSFKKQKNGFSVTADRTRSAALSFGGQKIFPAVNAAQAPNLYLTVNAGKLSSSGAVILIRMFNTDRHVLEAYGTIPAKTRRLKVSLGNWEYKNSITGIQILVRKKGGKFRKNPQVTITDIGLG